MCVNSPSNTQRWQGMTHIELKSSMFPLKPYFFILSQFLTVTGLKKLQVDVLQWQLVQ